MEDAMVLNKASVERGFAHGSIYKGHVSRTALPVIIVPITMILYESLYEMGVVFVISN